MNNIPLNKFKYEEKIHLYFIRGFHRTEVVVFGLNTCWWRIKREGVYTHPDNNLPCGPRKEMLMECEIGDFILKAENNPQFYGKHGLKTFMAAYHGNVVLSLNNYPTSFDNWDKYNQLIDLKNDQPGSHSIN